MWCLLSVLFGYRGQSPGLCSGFRFCFCFCSGCLPIFGDQFKTFFKAFQDKNFWNLRPVCTMNDKQGLGNEASAATQEIR